MTITPKAINPMIASVEEKLGREVAPLKVSTDGSLASQFKIVAEHQGTAPGHDFTFALKATT